MAHPYKASKAWQYSIELASAAEDVISFCAENGEHVLAQRMERASTAAHHWLAESHHHDGQAQRIACYKKARDAVEQLYVDVDLASSLFHLNVAVHKQLTNQAIAVYRILNELIRATSS